MVRNLTRVTGSELYQGRSKSECWMSLKLDIVYAGVYISVRIVVLGEFMTTTDNTRTTGRDGEKASDAN